MIPLASIIPNILSNKWFYLVIVILLVITTMLFINTRAYNKGYNTGVEVTEGKYAKEKIEWFAQVTNMKEQYENTINGILTSYNGIVAEMEQEIVKLKSKDPIIKTRYIDRYVPVEVNCTIPKGFVELHNISAQGKPLSENVTAPLDSTNTTLQDVGKTVAINYYEYNKVAEQLKALQKVVIEFQNKQKELVK